MESCHHGRGMGEGNREFDSKKEVIKQVIKTIKNLAVKGEKRSFI